MRPRRSTLLSFAASSLGALACALGAPSARAQTSSPPTDTTPQGTLTTTQASTGTTNVATSGFDKASNPDDKDAVEAKLSAGALGAAGNSRSLAITGAAMTRIRRTREQVALGVAANYAQSGKVGTAVTENVENIQGKARYDHFFVGSFAGFIGVSGRRDRFQGLNLRLNVDPGVAYYFVDEEKHQLWAEGGYDLQFDIRRQEYILQAAAAGTPIDKTLTQHGGRLFVGYANALSADVTFNTDLEYIQSFQDSERFRINWDAGISASIGGSFSIATTLLLQYDNLPLPTVLSADFTSSVSLVYKLF